MEAVQYYSVAHLKIHPKNSEFFDDISGADYEQFKTSIQNEGILAPLIVTPDLTVVSGHQRLKACIELGIEMVPVIIRQDIKSESDKLVALLAANFGRSKNSEAKQRKVVAEYAKLRGQGQGRPKKSSDNRKINLTQSEIAKELGVSVSTLNEILDIERKLTPEVKELLDAGAFTKTTASKILVKLSKEEQEELLISFGKEIIEGVTAKQMEQYIKEIQTRDDEIENIKAGYEIKLKAAKSGGDKSKAELIKEADELKLKARAEYERAEQYKKQLNKKPKTETPPDYESLKEDLAKREKAQNDMELELEELKRKLDSLTDKPSIPPPSNTSEATKKQGSKQTILTSDATLEDVCGRFADFIFPITQIHEAHCFREMSEQEMKSTLMRANEVSQYIFTVVNRLNNRINMAKAVGKKVS